MIRRSSLVALAVVVAVGSGLFQLKYEVRTLESRLARLNKEVLAEQEAVHVLSAEWSYLTDPARLARLSAEHLDLRTVALTEVRSLADVPFRTVAGDRATGALDAPASTKLAGMEARP